jgi:hypothetical protein
MLLACMPWHPGVYLAAASLAPGSHDASHPPPAHACWRLLSHRLSGRQAGAESGRLRSVGVGKGRPAPGIGAALPRVQNGESGPQQEESYTDTLRRLQVSKWACRVKPPCGSSWHLVQETADWCCPPSSPSTQEFCHWATRTLVAFLYPGAPYERKYFAIGKAPAAG